MKKVIEYKLSRNSSNRDIFEAKKKQYDRALIEARHKTRLEFKTQTIQRTGNMKRKRNIG